MWDILTLDDTVCVFHTKETKLTNLGLVIKKESIYFTTQRWFYWGQKDWKKAEVYTITWTLKKSNVV